MGFSHHKPTSYWGTPHGWTPPNIRGFFGRLEDLQDLVQDSEPAKSSSLPVLKKALGPQFSVSVLARNRSEHRVGILNKDTEKVFRGNTYSLRESYQ